MSYTRRVVFSAIHDMLRKIRLVAATLAWLAAFLLPLHAQIKIQKFQGKDVAAGQVLVKFRTTGQQSLASARSAGDIDSYRGIGGTGVYVMHSRSQGTAALLSRLGAHKDVAYVEPDYILHAAAIPGDARFGEQYALKNTGQSVLGAPGVVGADIGAAAAWDLGTGTAGHTVAVLDTGVDYNHPDLAANLWSSATGFSVQLGRATINCPPGTRGFNTIKRTCDAMDDNNHGTHLAGIIGAGGNNGIGISGVNWTASVLAVKFLDAKGTGTTSNAVDAIEFAIQMKASGQANVRVLSASWGDHVYSRALMDAVERAYQHNMLFVAAAGNMGSNNDLDPFYPASYLMPNVISVASTNQHDELDGGSNFGAASVHLGAPGTFILSTLRGGDYYYESGTSMSTAYVSGAAALALSICPDLGTADLRAVLLQTVASTTALASTTSSGGRLNVGNAAQACYMAQAFALSASSQSLSVARGETFNLSVHVSPVNGYTGEVNLQISGLPPGVTAGSATVNTSGTAVLPIAVTDSATPGRYLLTVLGSGGSRVRSTPVWLEVLRRRR